MPTGRSSKEGTAVVVGAELVKVLRGVRLVVVVDELTESIEVKNKRAIVVTTVAKNNGNIIKRYFFNSLSFKGES
jgi:hypothetical protein